MSTASARSHPRMSVGEFLAWNAERPDEARYELVHYLVIEQDQHRMVYYARARPASWSRGSCARAASG